MMISLSVQANLLIFEVEMTKEQENAFWQTIKAFKDIGLLQHVMVIGSWAEYLYPSLFETDLQSVIIRYNDAFFSLSDIYLHIININLIYAKALIPCKNQLFGLVYK